MSGLFKAFKTNEVAEQEGTPVLMEDAVNDDGTVPTFFVAYAGSKSNTKYRAALDAAYKPFKRQVEANNQAAKDKWIDKTNDLFCDYLIKGWENVLDADNNKINYSQEACRDLMRQLPVVLTRLVSHSVDYEQFRDEDLEVDAKN